MQNEILPSKEKKDTKPRRSAKNIMALIILGLCVFGIIGLSLLETVPRYIVLSIPPPEDSYDLVGWSSTTKSVVTTSGSRDFSWRLDTTLVYEDSDNIPSWNALAKYFEEHFYQIGWKKSDTSVPCNIYLPEAALLNYGENGFVSYRRVNDIDDIPRGDAICLAIWNDKGYPNVFRVVLLTIKRSFFTNFYTIFD
jgi:hypothetical protein